MNTPTDATFVLLTPTLATTCTDVCIEALAQASVQSPGDVYDALWACGFVAECERGAHSLETMIDGIRERLDADLTEAHLQGLWALGYEPSIDINGVRRAQSPLTLLAQGTPLLRACIPAYLPEVDLGEMVLSCDVRALPNERIFYERAVELVGCGATTPVLLGGDLSTNDAALAAGWSVVPANG
ncbi:MAG: hypothetical protein ACI9W2_003790 [Gammaproteobacteria bacterium]|jgi:hypothetical protein